MSGPQLTDAVNALLDGLDGLYLGGSVEELVFLLGSTPINPKVLYLITHSMDQNFARKRKSIHLTLICYEGSKHPSYPDC